MSEILETNSASVDSALQEAEGSTVVVKPQNDRTPVTNPTSTSKPTTKTDTASSKPVEEKAIKTPSSGSVSGGESVKMDYESLESACTSLNNECETLSELWSEMDSVINKKDEMWQGVAADRYFDELEINYKKAKSQEIDKNLKNYVRAVMDLIELNKDADRIINEQDILQINKNMPVISGSGVVTDAHGTNDALNNSVKTNDNIQSNATDPNAHTTNDELNNSVHTNDNVQSNATDPNAHTTNDELNNSVHTNDNIQSNTVEVNASKVDVDTINDVHTNSNVGADTSSEAQTTTPTTESIEDVVKAYAQASNEN